MLHNDLLLDIENYDITKSNTIENINNYKEYTDNICVIQDERTNKCVLPLSNLSTQEDNKEKYINLISRQLQTHYIWFSNHFLKKSQFSKIFPKKWP